MPGRPGAQAQAGERNRNSKGQRTPGWVREPRKGRDQQESGGDAQAGDKVGVGFGKGAAAVHGAAHSVERLLSCALRASKTRSGSMSRIAGFIVESRLYVVTARGLRSTDTLSP